MSRVMCLDQVRYNPLPRTSLSSGWFWDRNDPSEIVDKELNRLGDALKTGCWYLNPMVKVYSSEPTQFFLGVARKRQREWFRELSRQFRSGWRRLMDITTDLYQRRTGFTGILFIKGDVIDPRKQWQLEAQVGMHPGSRCFVLSRRPHAYSCLREQDWDSLKESSRAELEQQLSSSPMDPVYITPEITVMGFRADPAFYAEVTKRSNEWHGRLARILGNREMHALCRQADWSARLLVFPCT